MKLIYLLGLPGFTLAAEIAQDENTDANKTLAVRDDKIFCLRLYYIMLKSYTSGIFFVSVLLIAVYMSLIVSVHGSV